MRKTNDWQSSHYFLTDQVEFESIGLTMSVADIYHRVHNEDMLAAGTPKMLSAFIALTLTLTLNRYARRAGLSAFVA